MLKHTAAGVIAILISCGGFFGFNWYRSHSAATEESETSASEPEIKTDFISIAVFKEDKVRGYITFRARLILKNKDRLAEASYVISDTIHRKLANFSDLFSEDFRPKDAKVIEDPLFAALSDRLGTGEITSLELSDIAYDKRIP